MRVDVIGFDGFIQGESVEYDKQGMRSWKGNPLKKIGKHGWKKSRRICCHRISGGENFLKDCRVNKQIHIF